MPTRTGQPGDAGVEAIPLIERREFPRHPILQRCLVWSLPRRTGPQEPEGQRSIAFNISATGIGITTPLPPLLGSMLEIEAWGLAAPLLQAQVVRTTFCEYLWF